MININPKMKIFSKENFGPIIPIIKFDSDEELIRLANDAELWFGCIFLYKKIQEFGK